MANPYINKVVLGNETLLDLTADTVTAGKLASGITAHDKSGAPITGTAKLGSAYQDGDGYIVLGDDESDAPQGTLSITSNGTYDVSDYAGATVTVPTGAVNVVFGTFTASTAGTTQEVSVSYSGNGRPLFIGIYPSDGYGSGSTLYDTDHQYAIIQAAAFRRLPSSVVQGYGSYLYKSQATGTMVSGTRINGANMFDTQGDPTDYAGCVLVRGKNGFAVRVSDTSYGFLSGASYSYVIVYSS